MNFYQRVAYVFALEGFSGVWKRIHRKVMDMETPPLRQPEFDAGRISQEYEQLKKEFRQKIASIEFRGIERFLWYHTIDLGNGLVTPGDYDYRQSVEAYAFPEDMSGMHVLDVGSATGFFAFEFEKRGAMVTSVELPTIADWDMPIGEDKDATLKALMKEHDADSIEELHYLHLDGPFLFCQKRLNTHVQRCYSTIYDVCPEKLNCRQFDLVFIGDVLLHIFSPIKALSSIASVCRDRLIISQTIPDIDEKQPLMLYLGGDSRRGDSRTWWHPNKTCFNQMLKRVGFRTVEFVGEFEAIHRPTRYSAKRTIIHAIK